MPKNNFLKRKITHSPYELSQSDTIESLSKLLQIEKDTMISFHNIIANDDEIILHQLPKGLTHLYMQPHFDEKDLKLVPRTPLESGTVLRLKPTKSIINYGVNYTSTSGEEITTMDYEVTVTLLEKLPQQNFLFEVNRTSTIFFDNKEADSIIDELAEKVAQVLFPLVILVGENGICKDIYNTGEIKNRWQNKKEKIFDNYQGSEIENYLLACEQNFETKSNIKESFRNDWFLNIFFSGIYQNYYDNFSFKSPIYFPLLNDVSPIRFDVVTTIEKHLDENSNICITQNGIVNDPRTKSDLLNGLSFASGEQSTQALIGNYQSHYFLNPIDNTLKLLKVECDIELDKPKKVEIVIGLINKIDKQIEKQENNEKEEALPEKKKGWFF